MGPLAVGLDGLEEEEAVYSASVEAFLLVPSGQEEEGVVVVQPLWARIERIDGSR